MTIRALRTICEGVRDRNGDEVQRIDLPIHLLHALLEALDDFVVLAIGAGKNETWGGENQGETDMGTLGQRMRASTR